MAAAADVSAPVQITNAVNGLGADTSGAEFVIGDLTLCIHVRLCPNLVSGQPSNSTLVGASADLGIQVAMTRPVCHQ